MGRLARFCGECTLEPDLEKRVKVELSVPGLEGDFAIIHPFADFAVRLTHTQSAAWYKSAVPLSRMSMYISLLFTVLSGVTSVHLIFTFSRPKNPLESARISGKDQWNAYRLEASLISEVVCKM